MATRSNAQLWALSTAGTAKSLFGRGKVDEGRTATALGITEGSAFFEWSAGDDVDMTDPATWWEFHPALGFTSSRRPSPPTCGRCR